MKFLLTRNKEKGLYLFASNNLKFVVANVEDDNGIGNQVYSWWNGKYFATLEEALRELSK
ncbi:MAG: hypothetical protein M0P09_08130 [Acholeplasmataceae bacterium]|nr:hypothetical protein [Acholeplasmataceae bacterium]